MHSFSQKSIGGVFPIMPSWSPLHSVPLHISVSRRDHALDSAEIRRSWLWWSLAGIRLDSRIVDCRRSTRVDDSLHLLSSLLRCL